ncbi:unnamed protein product [Onchocerca ochengi]|uniref:Uncharacterized protein n=1 Tax=Onchocerca ochengi TaxID=42157 RepID=A0A182E0W7_ONCOC|nr:unnamed protein product [Onchocerca ochengi]
MLREESNTEDTATVTISSTSKDFPFFYITLHPSKKAKEMTSTMTVTSFSAVCMHTNKCIIILIEDTWQSIKI